MNRVPYRPSFSPYGAYALKATYQRNLGLALLSSLGIAGLPAIALVVWQALTPPVVPARRFSQIPHGDGSTTVKRPPTIVPDGPSISGSGVAPQTDQRGTLPVPVPDYQPVDSDAVVLSRAETSGLIDRGNAGAGSRGEGEGAAPAIDNNDLVPPRGKFQFREVYPVLIYEVKPVYPRQATALGLEGKVIIDALVDGMGSVRDAVVSKSSGIGCLDKAALDAAFLNKYKPGIQNGRPVMTWVTYQVVFVME